MNILVYFFPKRNVSLQDKGVISCMSSHYVEDLNFSLCSYR